MPVEFPYEKFFLSAKLKVSIPFSELSGAFYYGVATIVYENLVDC